MLTLWRQRGFSNFNREMENLFRSFDSDREHVDFAPAVDITEKDDRFLLTADLPGMKEEEIQISVHDGTLLLSGKREESKEEKKEGSTHRERRYGSFCRKFHLGSLVDEGTISAEYKSGVLSIVLPKKEEKKPKRITVSVN